MRKLFTVLAILLSFPLVVKSQFSVPLSPSAGYVLMSNESGLYRPTSTDPLTIGSIFATSSATSTFANGLNLTGGCFSISGTCIGGGSPVTAVTATWPILSSGGLTPIISFSGLSTSTSAVLGNIPYWTGLKTLGTVATGTLSATGPITVTANQSVIGSGATVACTTAASGVAGCLSSSAFDTFNNKQATISATWPITLTGAAVSFNGLSTSSAAAVSSLAYFSGVNTLAPVATTSVTCTTPLSCTSFDVLKGGGAVSLTTVPIASGGTNGTSFIPLNPVVFNGTSLVSTSSNPFVVGTLYGTTTAVSNLGGALSIGSSTPSASSTLIIVATPPANGGISTTTITIGAPTKRFCIETWNDVGTREYIHIVGTTLTVNPGSCK